VEVFSTRPPETIALGWGSQAKKETTYLSRPDPKGVAGLTANILRLPFRHIVDLAQQEGRAALRDLFLCIPLAGFLAFECRRQNIVHIHAHMSSRAATIASLASYMTGIPYSVTLHGQIHHYGPNQRINWSHAAFGIAVNQSLVEELRQVVGPAQGCPVIVQPMGVDSQIFSRTVAYQARHEGEMLRIFSCGRINRAKGHDIMIAALARLVERGEDIHLEIAGAAGTGQAGYATELRRLIEDLNLESKVTFLGACSEEQVREALLRSHVFVLASRSEGLGIAYLEALSCAVPAIGTNVGGVPEVIRDGETGLLVPPDDPAALADAIARLGRERDLSMRLSHAGREWAISRFNINDSARVLLRHAFPKWSDINSV
jgi:colanic acid/amylovoran biosynthesis glycosyltransferase